MFHQKKDKSKFYVKKFFTELVNENDRFFLEEKFFNFEHIALDLKSIVDIFYGVRCDVVHEGKYWEFRFCDQKNNVAMLNLNPDITVYMSLSELREIIGRACVFAIQQTKKI